MVNSDIPASDRRRPALSNQTLWAALTEFISTFIYVFAASGSKISLNNLAGDATFALISSALAHAFSLSAAVYGAARISGYPYTFCGHVNPAVTLGAFLGGNIHFLRVLVYWIAQLLGSIVACSLLIFVTGGQRVPVYGVSSGVGVGNTVVLEMVMTFGLVFTVYATMVDPRAKDQNQRQNVYYVSTQDKQSAFTALNNIAPLAMGLVVGANILAGGPFDGASMNPALSFGPALLSWSWANHWVYWVGPLTGGGLAGFVYELAFISN